ncbi:precorrin-6A synthase (deacetylating) [Sulfitobacter sp. LCG007]
MTELVLIGIGTGNPDHLTGEGRKALREADLILIPRKGPDKADLADLRRDIVAGVAGDANARIAEFDLPTRATDIAYLDAVERWHDAIAEVWARLMATHAGAGKVALLVWGDPSLYDSTLRIAARLDPVPVLRVIPGITSLQALTAAHAIPLNTLGGSVLVTTGRRLLSEGWPENADTVAVMLDGGCAFQSLDPQGLEIWWGAFLGMPEQILVNGPLELVARRIVEQRAEARAAHGWIMDTYLLRRTRAPR